MGTLSGLGCLIQKREGRAMSKREGFDKHALGIAAGLRRMADEIEREVACQESVSDTAQEIINTVTWGIATCVSMG